MIIITCQSVDYTIILASGAAGEPKAGCSPVIRTLGSQVVYLRYLRSMYLYIYHPHIIKPIYSVSPPTGYRAVSSTEFTLHKKMGGLAAYSRVSSQLPKELDA